jgi:hypothetical protein
VGRGGQLMWPAPPGRDRQNWGAAGTRHRWFKTGPSNTRLDLKKNTKDDILCSF